MGCNSLALDSARMRGRQAKPKGWRLGVGDSEERERAVSPVSRPGGRV